jgi:hypothetical protein
VVDEFGDGGALEQDVLKVVVQSIIGIFEQLVLEVFGQSGFHFLLDGLDPLVLLQIVELEIVPHLVLHFLPDFEVVHEGRVDDELVLEVVLYPARPQNLPDDVVDHVAVDDESEAKAEDGVGRFLRIVGSDVSIADGRDRIDSPVERVKILDLPAVLDDGRVGSGRVKPAN